MSKVYTADILEANDGTGDLILQFPDELLTEMNWKEGTELNLSLEKDGVIVITEKSDD